MLKKSTIYTVGHSTHDIDAFIELLAIHHIDVVADVRSRPFSRIAHFNREALEAALKVNSIKYVFLGRELGARRDERECYDASQAVYERIATLPAYRQGLDRLKRGAQKHTITLMCAEKEPLDCHRTVLVCRHLREMGFDIRHILADGSVEKHEDTEKRLVELTGETKSLFEPELCEHDLIERAYTTRGKQIAYRADTEGLMTNEYP